MVSLIESAMIDFYRIDPAGYEAVEPSACYNLPCAFKQDENGGRVASAVSCHGPAAWTSKPAWTSKAISSVSRASRRQRP
jgi:predicted CxxxxCH...CXXCH cytochrome family protein